MQSALAQEGASIELFVVGDGVEDDTRAALEPFLADPRVRFFDLPKGERHGERNRHVALEEAAGRIVCYLSDDDLLLPAHVATMLELLEDADFAHGAPFMVLPGDVLIYMPFDLAQASQQARLRAGDWNPVGLTGAAHTLAAYRRLPWGWRPAPEGWPTDLYMWQQFLDLPNFRGVTGTELTHLHFPSPSWQERPHEELVSALVAWSAAIRDPAGRRSLAERAHRVCVETCAVIDLRVEALDSRIVDLEERLADREAQLADVVARLADRDRDLPSSLRPLRRSSRRGPGGCATGCWLSGRYEPLPHGGPQLAERSQRIVPRREDRLLARPVDPEVRFVPAATELVRPDPTRGRRRTRGSRARGSRSRAPRPAARRERRARPRTARPSRPAPRSASLRAGRAARSWHGLRPGSGSPRAASARGRPEAPSVPT